MKSRVVALLPVCLPSVSSSAKHAGNVHVACGVRMYTPCCCCVVFVVVCMHARVSWQASSEQIDGVSVCLGVAWGWALRKCAHTNALLLLCGLHGCACMRLCSAGIVIC
jgi:hypothetical protein